MNTVLPQLRLQARLATARTVLFRPSVHVTRHNEKKLFFFFIRLKSKENLSAISAHFFFPKS